MSLGVAPTLSTQRMNPQLYLNKVLWLLQHLIVVFTAVVVDCKQDKLKFVCQRDEFNCQSDKINCQSDKINCLSDKINC